MDDNTIECPRCGEEFSLEFTRCPHCGLNLYPEDETPHPYPLQGGEMREVSLQGGESGGAGTGELLKASPLAALLGLILAGAVIFMANSFAARAESVQGLPTIWRVILVLAGPLGALVGGYSTGVIDGETRAGLVGAGLRPALPAAGLGALVGVGTAALVLLFETRWRVVTPQLMLEPGMMGQYALCLLMGALGGWLNGETRASVGAQGTSWEDLMYRDLLTRVRFNRDTAERLIEYERRQAPEAERFTLIRNALERLERDRK